MNHRRGVDQDPLDEFPAFPEAVIPEENPIVFPRLKLDLVFPAFTGLEIGIILFNFLTVLFISKCHVYLQLPEHKLHIFSKIGSYCYKNRTHVYKESSGVVRFPPREAIT